MSIRQRVRMRFSKTGDLRWIGHRDLAAAVERLFRRARLSLSLSEGFHPKPRISFPLSVAVGIEARDEVLEFELAEVLSVEELAQRLKESAIPGLEFSSIQMLSSLEPKARVEQAEYEFPVPEERFAMVEAAVAHLRGQETLAVEREGKTATFDLKTDLAGIAWRPPIVWFALRVTGAASVRPREVLAAVGVADLELSGSVLVRSRVLVRSAVPSAPSINTESIVIHEEGNAD